MLNNNNAKHSMTLNEFYPYYLREHQNPICRILHYIGSTSALLVLGIIIWGQYWAWLPLVLLIGYGFAWLGHFFFEGNKPATFQYPRLSFIGDWLMLKDFLTGQINQKLHQATQPSLKEDS